MRFAPPSGLADSTRPTKTAAEGPPTLVPRTNRRCFRFRPGVEWVGGPRRGRRFSRGLVVAVVSCPKCSAGLKVPDGAVAAVRCPKCATVFQPRQKAAADPGFEVVDESRPAA